MDLVIPATDSFTQNSPRELVREHNNSEYPIIDIKTTDRFHLDSAFLEEYKTKQPDWGPLGEITYRRTYSRLKADGTYEEWWETVKRVVEGVYTYQRWHCRRHGLPWKKPKSRKSAETMYSLIFDMKFLPPGRGLWMCGTDYVEKRGSACLNNCSFISTKDLDTDFAEPFCFLMDYSFLGIGVGADCRGAGLVLIEQPVVTTQTYVVEDSREGWVDLVRTVLNAYIGLSAIPLNVDYSKVRLQGAPITGFGGTSSGPVPLVELIESLQGVLNPLVGKRITSGAIVDIFNLIGRCVVAGGVRRTAEIMFSNADDEEFLNLKNPETNQAQLSSHRWASNNSVFCTVGHDYTKISELIERNGEPGIFWLENARKYSRMTDPADYKDLHIDGCNPCVPPGTRILTRNGYVAIETLIGKTIPVWNGYQWSEVSPRVTGENQPLVRVNLSDGTSLICTDYHEWVLAAGNRRNDELRIKARELQPGDTLAKYDMPVVESGLNMPYAYTHGFFCGDGQVGPSGSKGALLYGEKQLLKDHLEGQTTGVPDQYDRIWFGMPKDMPNKFIVPHAASISSRLLWLAGLLDADGTLLCNPNSFSLQISSINKEFLVDIRLMLTTLGVQAKVSEASEAGNRPLPDGHGGKKDYYCQSLYRLLINATDVQRLVSLGLKTHRLDLVSAKPQRDARRFVVVESVEKIGVAEVVYCFDEPTNHTGCFEGIITGQCSEQSLESSEVCNLVEIFPARLSSYEEFETAIKFAYLYAKTVTLLPTHNGKTNAVMLRNRRIGTSCSGITQAFKKHGRRKFFDWMDNGYKYIKRLDSIYSRWLCVPLSVKTTSVKPSGTISLLNGSSPGIHYPLAEYYWRVIRFGTDSRLIKSLRNAGYRCIELDPAREPNTTAVYFPVHEAYFDRSEHDVSMWEQLENAAAIQSCWADNQVSCTIKFKPEESSSIRYALELYETRLKSISFLPVSNHGYEHAPYQPISKEEYESALIGLKPIDFSISSHEVTEKFCDGASCTI